MTLKKLATGIAETPHGIRAYVRVRGQYRSKHFPLVQRAVSLLRLGRKSDGSRFDESVEIGSSNPVVAPTVDDDRSKLAAMNKP